MDYQHIEKVFRWGGGIVGLIMIGAIIMAASNSHNLTPTTQLVSTPTTEIPSQDYSAAAPSKARGIDSDERLYLKSATAWLHGYGKIMMPVAEALQSGSIFEMTSSAKTARKTLTMLYVIQDESRLVVPPSCSSVKSKIEELSAATDHALGLMAQGDLKGLDAGSEEFVHASTLANELAEEIRAAGQLQ